MRAEAAVAGGRSSASLLWDLRKFFEFIRLKLLKERGERAAFQPRVLAAVLAGYRFGRSVTGHAGATEPQWAVNGVTPGCGMAATMIMVYCLQPFDDLVASCRGLGVSFDCSYGDFHASAEGKPRVVAEALGTAIGNTIPVSLIGTVLFPILRAWNQAQNTCDQ